jgi:hypothetical protein
MVVCTGEERRGTGWWKMGTVRLKGIRGNSDQGTYPICRKDKVWSHILRCEGSRSCRYELVDKRFTRNDLEI